MHIAQAMIMVFLFFLIERKLLIWEANILPDKLILISGQKGDVMTKSASLHCYLVEVMSDCDMMLALFVIQTYCTNMCSL